MEQASIRLPETATQTAGKPEPETAPQSVKLPWREAIKRSAAELSVIAVCAGAVIAGAISGHESSEYHPRTTAPLAGEPDYEPISGLQDTSDDGAVINRQLSRTYHRTGHSIDVVGADQNAQNAFASFYEGDAREAPVVNEIIRVQDRKLFAPELRAEPNVYPFIIYNATDVPVDIRFLDYALEGTRSWLDEVAAHDDTVTIENHTQLTIESHATPHGMIMTDTMPSFLPSARFMGTDGFTTWYADPKPTRSFILPEGTAKAPFRKVAIATEICQSMVQVDAGITLPGGRLQENALERFVAYVNPRNLPARHDRELASKESICNGLGRVIAAGYKGGAAAIATLPEQAGKTGGIIRQPWIDFRMFDGVIHGLVELRQIVGEGDETMIITGKSSTSPTAAYYKIQEAPEQAVR
jgi:hypothetical protein